MLRDAVTTSNTVLVTNVVSIASTPRRSLARSSSRTLIVIAAASIPTCYYRSSRSMADSPDLSATHSMDTRWFAIDRDGSIAMFDSGEDGIVPDTVADQSLGHTTTHELAKLLGKRRPPKPGQHVNLLAGKV